MTPSRRPATAVFTREEILAELDRQSVGGRRRNAIMRQVKAWLVELELRNIEISKSAHSENTP